MRWRGRASTVEEALALMRARWDHAPFDPRDAEERIAIRFEHVDGPLPYKVLPCPPAVRVFRYVGDGTVSGYAHHPAEVDELLDELEEKVRPEPQRSRRPSTPL